MAPSRHLPSKKNPMMVEGIPEHAELVGRRRLGQTKLTARMVAAGPGDEIDPSSLCAFDYAHLRAPLPQGIVSGIFIKPSPGSYFLMRRSSDGYVSASGMFKAAFPYADAEEEEQERQHIKSLEPRSHDETAGNIWISPEQAVVLAEDYGVLPWIRALLDPTDIQPGAGTESSPPKKITSPPQFFIGASHPNLAPPTPSSIPRSSRSRRSAGPSKVSSKRSTASPRKRTARITSSQSSFEEPKETKSKSGKVSASAAITNGEAAAASLPTPSSSTIVETFESEPNVHLAPVEEEPKVEINIEQDTKVDDDGKEVSHTAVEVELPLLGEGPSPEDTARMIAEAKEMVKSAAETVAANSPSSSKTKGKRKAVEAEVDDEEDKENASSSQQPSAKRVKTEVELKTERVRTRALLGISATLAVGALVPYVMGML